MPRQCRMAFLHSAGHAKLWGLSAALDKLGTLGTVAGKTPCAFQCTGELPLEQRLSIRSNDPKPRGPVAVLQIYACFLEMAPFEGAIGIPSAREGFCSPAR